MAKVSIIKWIVKRLRSAIAIVEDTDTASQAIASGKYVMWKGDLYKASSAIAQGATLSSESGGNLTVVSDGGLNELNSNIATLSGNIGTLSNLTTSAKTSAVAAINEVNAKSWTVNQNFSSSTSLETAVRQAISASKSNGKVYYGTATWAGHDAGPYIALGDLALVFFGSTDPKFITNTYSKSV